MIYFAKRSPILGVMAFVLCSLSGCDLPEYQPDGEPPFWHFDPDESAPLLPPNSSSGEMPSGGFEWSSFRGKPMPMGNMNQGNAVSPMAMPKMPAMPSMNMGTSNVVHGPAEVSGFGNQVNVRGNMPASNTKVFGSDNQVNVFAGKK